MILNSDRFLQEAGFRCLTLTLTTEGPYTPKDSEWNYSDVPHLNHVHTRVSGVPLACENTYSSSLFLQQIGPLQIPASLHISHLTSDTHDYVMSILWIVIRVCTTHQPKESGGCLTKTDYRFYFRGIIGWLLASLALLSAKRNYAILMREDLPMRLQRHYLRQKGVSFFYDTHQLIGFAETLKLYDNNVDISEVGTAKRTFVLKLHNSEGEVLVSESFLRISWSSSIVKIWPMICPHEGADLSACRITSHSMTVSCPWHGRQLKPLVVFTPSVESSVKEFTFCHSQYVARVGYSSANPGHIELRIGPKCPVS